MSAGPFELRADLHVHTYHSGYASHFRFLRTRDCYSEPEAVYRTAKARGMDLVTFTDHDSISGCLEFLNRHPDVNDFFISEEIECRFPDCPMRVHVAAYGIDERIHAEVQRYRPNIHELTAYLRQEQVCFGLNHMFFFYQRQMPLEDYVRAILQLFPAFEVRNGAMLEQHNRLIEDVLQARERGGPAGVYGGSDAHTLRRVATTYTVAEGRTRDEYLASLRAGRGSVAGRHGTTFDVVTEIYGVIGRYWATLAGLGRPDLTWPRRTAGLAWSLASLPVEFVPAIVGVALKRQETSVIEACRRDLFPEAPARAPGSVESELQRL